MPIETSKDLFWLIASISLALITFFICWGLLYLVTILRDISRVATSVKKKIDLVDSVFKLIKEKLEKTSGHLTAISESVLKIVGYFMDRQKEKKAKKK